MKAVTEPHCSKPSPLLALRGVSKAFGGQPALAGVDLTVNAGSVHALVGENGAGKSTLMKILAGVHCPDAGQIRWRGMPVTLRSPRDAIAQGIAMIHQELNLFAELSVAENIWIGHLPCGPLGWIRRDRLHAQTDALLESLQLDLDADAKVSSLSIAQRQLVEIAKAVSLNADLLIMDEPTSALTEHEVGLLFAMIRRLQTSGAAIIYISHKLDELDQVADQLTVLRDGTRIASGPANGFSRDTLIRLMVGREVADIYPCRGQKAVPAQRQPVLEIRDLRVQPDAEPVSLTLHAGEILGLTGLIGAGRSTLAGALFGAVPGATSEILLDGKPLRYTNAYQALESGIALLTEDRQLTGCLPGLDLTVNLGVAALALQQFCHAGWIDRDALQTACSEIAHRLNIKCHGLDEQIDQLSGGNQQKVLLGRWLLIRPKVLILDEPTRGIDVGAKAEIYLLIRALAEQGVAILFSSSELPEVLGLSDCVLVMRDGRIAGRLPHHQATPAAVMAIAAGQRPETAQPVAAA